MPTVLIFRNELLPLSETFIQKQTSALVEFHPKFVGLRRYHPSLPLAEDPVLLSHGGLAPRARGMLYKWTGIAPRFHQRVRHLNASLMHAHFSVDGVNALPSARAASIPLIVTLHGSDVTTTDNAYQLTATGRVYLARRHQLWKKASTFLCISDFMRRKAAESGFPEHKLRVHYIGIDLAYFQSQGPAKPAGSRQTVLFVGRLVQKKGCTYLIRAMARLQSCFPSARLVVIGDGPERPGLESQARELRVRCEFHGAQSSTTVRKELEHARVFCVPSIAADNGDSEGLGMVFAEAQAMGVPVVSTLHGGIPEVVCHGSTGLLTPERDHDSLAEHLIRFFRDEVFWQDCSNRAVTWIHQKFDIRRQTACLEDIYRDVVQARVQ